MSQTFTIKDNQSRLVASTAHISVYRPVEIVITDFPTTPEGIDRLIQELDQFIPPVRSTILDEMKKKGTYQ